MDSKVHFEARTNEYEVPQAFLQALRREGITTVGHLAFAIFRPGAEFKEREFDNWAQSVNNKLPLTGLNISGTGEPSHALLDECAHQFETRVLKYLEPAKCTSCENEITAGRTDRQKAQVGRWKFEHQRVKVNARRDGFNYIQFSHLS